MAATVQFVLWRQDDNGHRFLVDTFGGREPAEAKRAQLTRTLHKQFYWIEEIAAGPT